MKILFEHEMSTKGAHRYHEVDDQGQAVKVTEGAQIGTLYIRKTAMPTVHQFIMVNVVPLDLPTTE